MRKPRMLGLSLLLMSLLSPLAMAELEVPLELSGNIQRYDSVTHSVYIDGQRYRLRGQALELLGGYREANGPGSLAGKTVAYRTRGSSDGSDYIDLVQWVEAE